ncbi:hypothetical protein VTJ04DRAFT_3724 [Mycothermus thermophilus]|uniref:uncharacterized protein n=1 Tax=Humicola insolens TaxID=85995 RepID=UPI0037449407
MSEQQEENLKVAFLGPFNSYSHEATKLAFPSSKWQLEPTKTIQEVFDRVQTQQARYGVVPFENSTAGTVSFTLEGLADRTGTYADLLVCDEVYLDVHHFLLGRIPKSSSSSSSSSSSPPKDAQTAAAATGVTATTSNPGQEPHPSPPPIRTPLHPLSHIKRIYSHPQALGQTAKFLAQHLPHAETVEVSSTSRGAALAAADPEGVSAAVAGESAGRAAGLDVLARWIEDMPGNCTRFFILRRKEDDAEGVGGERRQQDQQQPTKASGSEEEKKKEEEKEGDSPYAQGRYKSLVSFTVPHHRPGALAGVLDCFRARGTNLTSINSVPSLAVPFQYLFFVEFEGSRLDDPEGRVEGLLGDLGKATERWRWLGSWRNRRGGR